MISRALVMSFAIGMSTAGASIALAECVELTPTLIRCTTCFPDGECCDVYYTDGTTEGPTVTVCS
jgi:hypothetical protein